MDQPLHLSYLVVCPACGQPARITEHVYDLHPSVPDRLPVDFRCLRGCRPDPVDLRQTWTAAAYRGRTHTA